MLVTKLEKYQSYETFELERNGIQLYLKFQKIHYIILLYTNTLFYHFGFARILLIKSVSSSEEDPRILLFIVPYHAASVSRTKSNIADGLYRRVKHFKVIVKYTPWPVHKLGTAELSETYPLPFSTCRYLSKSCNKLIKPCPSEEHEGAPCFF